MEPTAILAQAMRQLAGMEESEFELSLNYWQHRAYTRNEYYNQYKNVCKYLGFIVDGVFRTYYIDGNTNEEKNVFFFSKHQIVVSFQSFITQQPCNYYTQSMTDSQVLYIHVDQLQKLYAQSHAWEKVGRRIAELAFSLSMKRTESFLFQTPEERYNELVTQHPDIFNSLSLGHISSYLGIQQPSLSRIRKRMATR